MKRTSILALASLLAGCGGGPLGIVDNNNDGIPDDEQEDVTTCDGNPFTLRIDAASLAANADGFDLDAHDTRAASDPIGCGKVDATGGVDNALSDLAPTIASFGFDLEAALADAIQGGDVVIDITIYGYDGGPDDACVLVDAASNGEMVATSVESTIVGNTLFSSLPQLALAGTIDPGTGPTYVNITLRDVELELPMTGAPDDAQVSGGLLGAGIPWDEAGDDDLRSLVLANLPSYVPASLAEGIVADVLDLLPPGSSSGSCDALSSALIVDASAL